MKSSICCIFNYPSHYNYNIFCKMGNELNCHFYFGNKLQSTSKIKKIDLKELKGFQYELNSLYFGRWYYLKGSLFLLFKYNKFIITGEPYGISNWLLLLFGKLFHKHIYVWSHGWYGRESSLKKIIKKIFFSLAKGSFLYGNYAKTLMVKEGLNASKLFIIYNSLNYSAQLKIRKLNLTSNFYDKHFGNSNPIIIFSGRLIESKKLSLLLEAVSILKKNEESFVFNVVLVGTGNDETYLKRYAETLGVKNNVWFYGPCYDEQQIAILFSNSSLCVSPGEIGLTAIHSMSYGVPVITHDNFPNQGPEFEAVIPRKTGMFFKENDVNSLIEAIRELYYIVRNDSKIIKENCYYIIDTKYNPDYQIEVLKNNLK
jgi:glycosyltransferase involved in cell wall biosynthesis